MLILACLSIPSFFLLSHSRIPYDHPSCIQIESAYQAGRSNVRLTEGYFMENPGYSITFDRSNPPKGTPRTTWKFTQINTKTQNPRQVRRIADDDDNLFIPITAAEQITMCSVCQENFDESTSAPTTATTSTSAPSSSTSSTTTSTSSASSSSSSSNPELQPVRLKNCSTGHGYHRGCIAQWIKLKDHCPLCHRRIGDEGGPGGRPARAPRAARAAGGAGDGDEYDEDGGDGGDGDEDDGSGGSGSDASQ